MSSQHFCNRVQRSNAPPPPHVAEVSYVQQVECAQSFQSSLARNQEVLSWGKDEWVIFGAKSVQLLCREGTVSYGDMLLQRWGILPLTKLVALRSWSSSESTLATLRAQENTGWVVCVLSCTSETWKGLNSIIGAVVLLPRKRWKVSWRECEFGGTHITRKTRYMNH